MQKDVKKNLIHKNVEGEREIVECINTMLVYLGLVFFFLHKQGPLMHTKRDLHHLLFWPVLQWPPEFDLKWKEHNTKTDSLCVWLHFIAISPWIKQTLEKISICMEKNKDGIIAVFRLSSWGCFYNMVKVLLITIVLHQSLQNTWRAQELAYNHGIAQHNHFL